SYEDDEALFAAIMAGAAGYVLKQIRGTDLVDAVRRVAAGQSLLDPAPGALVRGDIADLGKVVELLSVVDVEVGAAVGRAALADVAAVPAGRVDELARVGDPAGPRHQNVVGVARSGADHPLWVLLLHDDLDAVVGRGSGLAQRDREVEDRLVI